MSKKKNDKPAGDPAVICPECYRPREPRLLRAVVGSLLVMRCYAVSCQECQADFEVVQFRGCREQWVLHKYRGRGHTVEPHQSGRGRGPWGRWNLAEPLPGALGLGAEKRPPADQMDPHRLVERAVILMRTAAAGLEDLAKLIELAQQEGGE